MTGTAGSSAFEKADANRTKVEDDHSGKVGLENKLREIVAHACELLPAQGPITAFVFLNNLQAMEDVPFHEGVQRGARLFGNHPYLTEDRYREKFLGDRIVVEDLIESLRDDLKEQADETVAGSVSRLIFRLAMLQYPLRSAPNEELRWFIAETDALQRLRKEASAEHRDRFVRETKEWVLNAWSQRSPEGKLNDPRMHGILEDLLKSHSTASIERWSDSVWEEVGLKALWRICREGVHARDSHERPKEQLVRHRDYLLEATGVDTDELVHEVLIRFCAAFTDQGLAEWGLPHRDMGFYHAFCFLYRQQAGSPEAWQDGLAEELSHLEDSHISPMDSLFSSLHELGINAAHWPEFVTATLLALRGWAGMLNQMEVRADRVPQPVAPGTMIEFLAIRLVLERFALKHVARKYLNYEGALSGLRDATRAHIAKSAGQTIEKKTFLAFQLSQVLDWTPPKLFNFSRVEWNAINREMGTFRSMERRRIFHVAFERNYRMRALDALSVHAKDPQGRTTTPRFQAVFCIDTREESFRRHLEEVAPDCETFGAAGFFAVAMYFKSVSDAHYSTLCPIVVKPQHWVTEEVVYTFQDDHRRRANARKALGTASRQVHVGSRQLAGGALLTASLGVLASVPLVTRVLFPRLTARIRREAGRFVEPPKITRLRLERSQEQPGPEGDGIGYSLPEMANIGERILREIGLVRGFARLVAFIGHGSFCLNNPHKSAYDCGACSGGAGGPNARALAMMLNDPRVREILASRGIEIPQTTRFIGGLHNTCADSVSFSDLELLPMSHLRDFEKMQENLEDVCDRNAHERCRRFQSAPLTLSFSAARRHVEGRSEDLAQTRPEFGNCTNAMAVVGRRTRTRGLYMDRRSFLVSYDPLADDPEYSILSRILGAVVVVCSGINLQYFFSYVDSRGWGCGTKLPHNVTSLLGVMDGASSDLRPGLPWQGVEIHEPMRLLMVMETTPNAIEQIMDRNPTVGRILRNQWVQLALLSPHDNSIQVYQDGQYLPFRASISELSKVTSSVQWYRGQRGHLPFAEIIQS